MEKQVAILNEHNFEVYTINPETGETGWDIKFVSVMAPNRKTAKEYLKKWPLFDCVILHNYSTETGTTTAEKHKLELGEIYDTGDYYDRDTYNLLFKADH